MFSVMKFVWHHIDVVKGCHLHCVC